MVLWLHVATMLEVAVGIVGTDRTERPHRGLKQRLKRPRLRLPKQLLHFGEGLPTFMCVVQAHILDDACGLGMAREGLPFDGSRGMAPRPRWRPRSLIEISD